MKITAMLCNHAEVRENLLFISGAGIGRSEVPPGTPPPWGVNLALAVQVSVPWTSTNEQHTLTIRLIDEDGQPAVVPQADDQMAPVEAQVQFSVGRPPGLVPGDDQLFSFAMGMPQLPIFKLGGYIFVIEVDGTPLAELNYRVAMAQGVTVGGGGPTSLPRF